MKIEHLKISNIFGARYIDLATAAPIQLFAGQNGACKSSIQEAVRMAFSGETTRVTLKRDYPLIVSEGAKAASVCVTTDEGVATLSLPKHTHELTDGFERGLPDALPYVLNAQQFASMKGDDRRTFLFGLTNCQVTEASLRRMLTEAGCEGPRVEQTLPLLKSIMGFPAAAKFAGDKATEGKGNWRGLTGETWGSKKGEVWEAEKPEIDAEALAYWEQEHSSRQLDLNEALVALGAIQQARTAFANDASRREVLTARAGRIDELKAKQETETAEVVDLEEEVKGLEAAAGEAPKTGLEHDFARAVEYALDAIGDDPRASIKSAAAKLNGPFAVYIAKFGLPSNAGDDDARSALPLKKAKLTAAKNALQVTSRALAECEAAKAQLADMPTPESVSIDALAEAEDIVEKLKGHVNEAQAEFNKLDAINDQLASSGKRTQDAKAAHDDIMAWSKLADALGSEGIPAQILARALKPINTALRKSAMVTGWRQASINPDMSITAEGRIYDLLCESEKWRVDAMIAEAIASLSGIGILMLDRVDVLQIPARVELLLWLDGRATEGAIKSALLFATLRELPKNLPENISAVWLENGEITEQTERLAA